MDTHCKFNIFIVSTILNYCVVMVDYENKPASKLTD